MGLLRARTAILLTYKFYRKVLSKFDIKIDCLIVLLFERHVFNVETCLLLMKKFEII
jgi:hypothetical protein